MVSSIFSYILRFGIEAGWLAAALIVLRLILRKAPRGIICAMWAFVAVRLILPLDIKSVFSLVPDTSDITRPVSYAASEAVRQAYPNIDSTPLMTAGGTQSNSAVASGDAVGAHLHYIASIVWIVGVCLMLIYAIFSYIRLYRLTRESIKADGHYLCDRISSPFILGIFRPRIILPFDIGEEDKPYVLAHERAHLKRRDHLWKPLGYLLLSVYWFNPLLWIAYILLCRDIELACDERVIKELGYDCKKPYANALINAAAPKRLITACPVAFGETSVKARVKNILSYKKPAFWIIIIAVILSIVVAVCFLTNPADKSGDTDATDSVSTGVSAEYVWSSFEESTSPQDGYGFVHLRVNNNTDQYIAVDMSGFRVYKDDKLLTPSSSDDTQYYDFYKAGTSHTPMFSVYPYLAEIDTKSAFRLEADYYSFIETDASEIDGEYPPNVGKDPLGSISVDFKFLSKEERGDVPDFLYEILYHDIDGDGEEEMLVLSDGPTSGILSFTVGAYDKDTHKEKYKPNYMSFFGYSNRGENPLTVIDGQAVLTGYDVNTDNPEGKADRVVYAIKATDRQLYFKEINRKRGEIDLSDMDYLTVSSDMPNLKYADERIAVFDGDCGMVIYSFEEEKVTDRLSLDALRGMDYSIPYINVTADGKEIYIFDHKDDLEDSEERFKYIVYSSDDHVIISHSSHESWPTFDRFSFNDQRYNIEHDDEIGNISVRTYRKGNTKTGTQYELTVPGWKIKNMQLTIKNADGSEKTYRIFE